MNPLFPVWSGIKEYQREDELANVTLEIIRPEVPGPKMSFEGMPADFKPLFVEILLHPFKELARSNKHYDNYEDIVHIIDEAINQYPGYPGGIFLNGKCIYQGPLTNEQVLDIENESKV